MSNVGAPSHKLSDVNKVVTRLAQVGIRLGGSLPWSIDHVHPYPLTLYFQCKTSEGIIQAAESSKKLVRATLDTLPKTLGSWTALGELTLVFVELNSAKPIRLEISLTVPGKCRASLLHDNEVFVADGFRMARLKTLRDNPVFSEIAKRLDQDEPRFRIEEHIDVVKSIGPNRLVGIDFRPRDVNKLLTALKAMKSGANYRFVDPKDPHRKEHGNELLLTSLAATNGYGLREAISDVVFDSIDQVRDMPASALASEYAAGAQRFDARPQVTATALHFGLSADHCNAHVDEVAFVFYDSQGDVVVDLQRAIVHSVDELGSKTGIPAAAGFVAKKLSLGDSAAVTRAVQAAMGRTFLDVKPNSTKLALDLKKSEKATLTLTLGCDNCSPLDAVVMPYRLVKDGKPKSEKQDAFFTVTWTRRF